MHSVVSRDVLILALVDAVTCILAGFAIFSILGNLALNQGKDVGDVVKEGEKGSCEKFLTWPHCSQTCPDIPWLGLEFLM